MMSLSDNSTPVVVINALHQGGLGITRTLGKLGIPVYSIAPDAFTPSLSSRYCHKRLIWDIERVSAEESVKYLLGVSQNIGRRPLLIASADDPAALFVAHNAEKLRQRYTFPQLDVELVDTLYDKKRMYYLARKFSVATAETAFPQSRGDVLDFLKTAVFPLMLKGIDGTRLKNRTGLKMLVVHNERELLESYDSIEDPRDPNLMLQEYIPGGDDTVWMFNGYFDGHSECLVGFTGKKIRQCPVYTGSTSLGICLKNEMVEKTTKQFMKAIGYKGVLDIGYRYDARDGSYKLLDVNPRIGATFRLFVAENGMDVVRALYLDLTGQTVTSATARDGRKWIVEDRDLTSCWNYYRDGKLNFRDWLRSLRGIEEAAFASSTDPLPIFARGITDVKRLLAQVFDKTRQQPEAAQFSPTRIA
jgi:D-aspartate ligase